MVRVHPSLIVHIDARCKKHIMILEYDNNRRKKKNKLYDDLKWKVVRDALAHNNKLQEEHMTEKSLDSVLDRKNRIDVSFVYAS